MLVVFAEATTNGFLNVKVSESAFFLQKVNMPDTNIIAEQRYRIKDAEVMYSVNDGEQYPLIYTEVGYVTGKGYVYGYIPDYKTAPRLATGDKVTVYVSHPRFASTTASEYMPPKIDIDLTGLKTYEKITNKGDTVVEHHLTYHIPYVEDNSYVGRIIIQDDHLNQLPIMSNDLLFQELNYTIDSQNWREIIGSMFSFEEDEAEDYRPYLDFRMSDIPKEGKDVVIVTRGQRRIVNGKLEITPKGLITDYYLYTANTYLYMQSMKKYEGSSTSLLGLEEKVQVYGNFSGNTIGCLTANYYYSYIVYFKEE